jgi:hypothetical protein
VKHGKIWLFRLNLAKHGYLCSTKFNMAKHGHLNLAILGKACLNMVIQVKFGKTWLFTLS